MQIVIPMSGSGARFGARGYAVPKPLIEVDGKPMIEHVVGLFPGVADILFICSREHLQTTSMESVLRRIAPQARIAAIEPHKRGPVHAVLAAQEFIRDDNPVIVSYCDYSAFWDFGQFRAWLDHSACDGCVVAYRGFHPHSLGPNLYAYMRNEGDRMVEIREKHCFTDNRMQEFASAGMYYMRSGRLLKRYFGRAIHQGLATNGEYYASMPFNLLAEDGLDVRIYELEHFLQWGTPEDLEEYRAWSDYFRHCEDWRPSGSPLDGVGLLPAAGRGVRFQKEGYSQLKPFIPAGGVPMFRRTVATLPRLKRWIIVSRNSEIQGLLESLEAEGIGSSERVNVEQDTEGQLCSCLLARDRIDPDGPLAIFPCDATFTYDERALRRLLASGEADCVVWTFRSHPHARRHPEQYGWAQADERGRILQASCKRALHEDVSGDHGMIGGFWFRSGRLFLQAADSIIARNLRINKEFYVDTMVGMMVESGARCVIFDVDHYISMGTPDDVRTYEYWQAYFDKIGARKGRGVVHGQRSGPAFHSPALL